MKELPGEVNARRLHKSLSLSLWEENCVAEVTEERLVYQSCYQWAELLESSQSLLLFFEAASLSARQRTSPTPECNKKRKEQKIS